MIAFFRAYPRPAELLPQPVAKVVANKVSPRAVAKLTAPAKVPQPVAQIPAADSVLWSVPWGHHALLLENVKDLDHRVWYMGQTLQHGWSRNILSDDLAQDDVGCYGQKLIQTPNLDRMAREGTRFTQAYFRLGLSDRRRTSASVKALP